MTYKASASVLQQSQQRVARVWMSLTDSNPHAWVHQHQMLPAAAQHSLSWLQTVT